MGLREKLLIGIVSLTFAASALFPLGVSHAEVSAVTDMSSRMTEQTRESVQQSEPSGETEWLDTLLSQETSTSVEDETDMDVSSRSIIDQTQKSQDRWGQEKSTAKVDQVTEDSQAAETTSSSPLQEENLTLTLDSNEIEVSDISALKAALEAVPPSGVDTIYLAGDIQLEVGGIAINAEWSALTIVGHPKDDSTSRHTVYDYTSGTGTQGNNIVVGNSNMNLTIREVDIEGRNYYGTFTVLNSSTYAGVTITFDGVNYEGPQPTYNRWGLTRYLDSTLIVRNTGGATPQEMGEVNRVEIGGVTLLEKQEGSDSMLWFPSNNNASRYLKILEGATVTVSNSTTGSSNDFLYVDGTPSVPVTVERNASLSVTTRDGFARGTMYVDSITLEEGSTLKVVQTGDPSNKPTIYINSSLMIGTGATLDVQRSANNRTFGLISFYGNGGTITMNDPKRVQLYNPNARLVTWQTGSGTIEGTVGSINSWAVAPSGGYEDSIDNMPTSIWNRNGGEAMKLLAAANTSSMTSVSLTASDGATIDDFPVPEPLTTATFNTYTAYMMVMGSYRLSADDIHASDSYITGEADSDAIMRITYDHMGSQTLSGLADSIGLFQIAIPDSSLPVGMEVMVLSHHEYLKARHASTVLDDEEGYLEFGYVPDSLPFQTATISPDLQTVVRQDADWGLSINDTRGSGQTWQLSVIVDHPLTAVAGDDVYLLPGALVYVDSAGTRHVLGNASTLIMDGTTGSVPETEISWAADRGVLVQVDASSVRAGLPYSTTIEWLLSDVP